MDEKVKVQNGQYVCMECKNENNIPEGKAHQDIIECEFCGIEYEIQNHDGEFSLMLIEEEK